MKQRATTTGQLARVIQLLQLGKKTGLLTIEHGEHATYEEGSLVFINGQITEARVGLRYGRNALSWLSTWDLCRFVFVPMAAPPTPIPPTPGDTNPLRLRTTQKLPAIQIDTDPLQQARTTRKLPSLPPADSQMTQQPSQKLVPMKPVRPPQGDLYGQARPPTPPAPPAIVPYQTRPIAEALRLLEGYSHTRAHKHLLLLIDGQRTTVDLMRLMGRPPDEMSRLIADLRYLGLIGLRV